MIFGNNNPYLAPDHPILKEKAAEVPYDEINSTQIQEIIDSMLELAVQERKQGRMVGLAAPQIGIPLQIILVDTRITSARLDFSHMPEVFINPKIIWQSEEKEEFREGCFSTGSVFGIVPRSLKVVLEAYTRAGEKIKIAAEGYTARIFQHEIDHLMGIRFPNRIVNSDHLHWVEAEELQDYRANFQHWHKKCSYEEWFAYIKSSP